MEGLGRWRTMLGAIRLLGGGHGKYNQVLDML
jgi:hypothetical protein